MAEIGVANGALALSAAVLGVAAVAILASARMAGRGQRSSLAILHALVAVLAAGPLVGAFLPGLAPAHLLVMLPALMALPVCVRRYAERLVGAAPARGLAWWRRWSPTLAGAVLVAGFLALPSSQRLAILVDGADPVSLPGLIWVLCVFVLILAWCARTMWDGWQTARLLRRYRNALKHRYSNTEGLEVREFDVLLGVLAVGWVLIVGSLVTDNLWGFSLAPLEGVLGLGLAFEASLLLAGLTGPGRAEAGAESRGVPEPAGKYGRSALSAEQAARIAGKLERVMRDSRLYEDASLSLGSLAKAVGAAPNLVSQTLNETVGETFFDFVNRWRVEAAKPRLLSGRETVLDTALAVGFNSRSTFYKAFKRNVGCTPRAYRQQAGTAGDRGEPA
ncbi:helix-turn-helix domain-containing protein [Maricaulis sp. CAU 1757]